MELHTCSHEPLTQRPILQPILGSGLRPQDIDGVELHTCSQTPLIQRPILQPILGRGFNPQLNEFAIA